MKKIGFIFISIIIFTVKSYATDTIGKLNEEIKNDLSGFSEALPQEVVDFIGRDTFNGDFNGLFGENLTEGKFLDLAVTYLFSGLNTVLKSFASILALLVIIALFNSLADTTAGNVKNVFSLCSTLCVAISVFGICVSLASNARAFMTLLCQVTSAFLPVMITVLTLSGSMSSAVVTNGSMLLFINLIESFLLKMMLPVVNVCLAFSCVKALNKACDLSGISKIVRTTFTSVTVFVMSIFLFVLSYKGVLSQSADTLSIKTARFAISSFVPLVGSSVNDALRTLSSGIATIKSSCGVIAIVAISVITLPIIINLFLNKLSFNILSIVSGAIGGQGEKAILDEADSICTFLLTLCACTSVLFILGLTIFIKTGVTSL